MVEGGGEFGYNDPGLDKKLDHNDDEEEDMKRTRLTQPGLSNQVRHPLLTTGVKKLKCKLCSTSSPACLTLLMKKPFC